jgi:hypothetical protein
MNREGAVTSDQMGLRIAAGVAIGFGLAVALAAWPPLAGPTRLLAGLLVWPLHGAETGAARDALLLLAIGGGGMAGWGWLIWQPAGAPLERGPALVRGLIRQSVLVRFILDSLGSPLAGVPLSVAGNAVFAALVLVPMARARAAGLA